MVSSVVNRVYIESLTTAAIRGASFFKQVDCHKHREIIVTRLPLVSISLKTDVAPIHVVRLSACQAIEFDLSIQSTCF